MPRIVEVYETDECPEHGKQKVTNSVSAGDIRHVHLACGCTREYVNETLHEGDIVMHENVLFRLESFIEGASHPELARVLLVNKFGEKSVYLHNVKRIGADTITGMKPHGVSDEVKDWELGDWVRHYEFGIVGQVVGLRHDGRIKVETYSIPKDKFTYYVWPPEMLVEVDPDPVQQAANKVEKRSPYGRSGAPGQSSYDWGGDQYRQWSGKPSRSNSWDRDTSSSNCFIERGSSRRKGRKKSAPKDNISTGELIDDRVKQLKQEDNIEKKSSSRTRLRTAAPTLKLDSDEKTTAIPKRKGEWAPTPEPEKKDEEEFEPVVPRRKGSW
jgi:hypothetical protein